MKGVLFYQKAPWDILQLNVVLPIVTYLKMQVNSIFVLLLCLCLCQ